MKLQKLTRQAEVVLHDLEQKIGETIGIGAFSDDFQDGWVLAESDGTSGFSFHLNRGYRFPLHVSAPGKVLLAYLPTEQRESILAQIDFKPFTPNTITDIETFRAELEQVLINGFAVDASEHFEGCHCIGVPVFDEDNQVIAAIWTTGHSSRLPISRFKELADILNEGALALSRRLSSTGRNPDRTHIISTVNKAKTIIDDTLHAPIDIRQLATELHVGYSWFRKVFKEQTGHAPSEYSLLRRIQKAEELLHSTDLSIRQISEELGFKTQNHFSALFKRKTGHSPSQYRQEHQLSTE